MSEIVQQEDIYIYTFSNYTIFTVSFKIFNLVVKNRINEEEEEK